MPAVLPQAGVRVAAPSVVASEPVLTSAQQGCGEANYRHSDGEAREGDERPLRLNPPLRSREEDDRQSEDGRQHDDRKDCECALHCSFGGRKPDVAHAGTLAAGTAPACC